MIDIKIDKDKWMKSEKVELNHSLEDAIDRNLPSIKCKTIVVDNKILIGADGYGEKCSLDAYPIMIENCEGKFRVIIWGDINQEDPTHIINLDGAKESCRLEEIV